VDYLATRHRILPLNSLEPFLIKRGVKLGEPGDSSVSMVHVTGGEAGLFPPQPTTRHYPIDPIYSTYLYMLEHTFDGARDTSS
jgi:hypothetical protein